MRRFVLLSVVLGVTSGCAVEKFAIRDRACDEKFTKWSGGLTHHLLRGKRTKGLWDYDPSGDVEVRHTGSYDFETGDFDWTVRFHPDHWRERVDVEGYGFARPNGNLDVEYTRTTRDVLGEERTVEVREQRVQCDVVRRVRTETDLQITEGRYEDGVYRSETWLASDDSLVVKGVERPDGTWTEEIDLDGYHSVTRGQPDGTSQRTFTDDDAQVPYEGKVDTELDGTERWLLVFDDGTTWDYAYDYAGDGGGTYETPDLRCDLTYEAFECTADCDDGNTYACS